MTEFKIPSDGAVLVPSAVKVAEDSTQEDYNAKRLAQWESRKDAFESKKWHPQVLDSFGFVNDYVILELRRFRVKLLENKE